LIYLICKVLISGLKIEELDIASTLLVSTMNVEEGDSVG
jgi:hypothetical protein